MDTLLSLINGVTCGLIALALLGAIMSKHVHDGIIMKVGLVAMMFGFGSIALRMFDGLGPEDSLGLARSIMLVNSGIAVVILGYLVRRVRAHHPVRRMTDFTDFDSQPAERAP